MLESKIFARYPLSPLLSLSTLSSSLYREQKKQWLMLTEGANSLESVRIKDVRCSTFDVRLQYNPKRIVSTGAKVDAASIKERTCFLCVAHLPEEQQGVLYREKFLILCNPMPIFKEHFTISHVEHIAQSLEEHIVTMLDLAQDFSDSHTVFYNGPKCGASAPDHMHFQASPKNGISVEGEAEFAERRKFHKRLGEVDLYSLVKFGRSVVVMESSKKQDAEFVFLRLTGAMRKVMNTNDEPMMNVLCSFTDGVWRFIVFPRTKHRPDAYFKEGDEKILISPAAVDIGGLIITPIEKDFDRVDAAMIEKMYDEVSVPAETLENIIDMV
jgi:ATP adenylyltransferase/5',5'''-P-1,P-4-tetraphosphate phosphorylase II